MAQKSKIATIVFRLLLLFEILWGAHAWFTWPISESKVVYYGFLIVVAFISYQYKVSQHIHLQKNSFVFFALFSYMVAVMFLNRFSLPSQVGVVLRLFPIWVALSDKIDIHGHVKFITQALAVILAPGIILYIVSLFIFLPGVPIQYHDSEAYLFINHFFLIERIDEGFSGIALTRFHSVFLEPGYLGTMLSFWLFAIKFDFKSRAAKVLLAALLLSFSLAGYITTILGYIIYLNSQHKSIIKIVIVGGLCYFIASSYNGGDNLFNKGILERLEYDEEKVIAGNNRTGEATDYYFDMIVENGEILFGLGSEIVDRINGGSSDSGGYNENIRGAGYKVFLVRYGLLSAFFFFLFYFFIGKVASPRQSKIRLGFLFLIAITFIQAAYPESPSWIFPYILGLNHYSNS